MKVVCISLQDFSNGQAIGEIAGLIDVGDKFTVTGSCIGYGRNDVEVACYWFAEFRHTNQVFDQRNFAPFSDLDETTLVNEEWQEKVCEAVNVNV